MEFLWNFYGIPLVRQARIPPTARERHAFLAPWRRMPVALGGLSREAPISNPSLTSGHCSPSKVFAVCPPDDQFSREHRARVYV